ncbi:hypothetical protein AGMMS49942_21670 [Spirochaetia bacterium]|nr:hypothetical protein AGMMS49942_21670 [Spirochaetia bacterium]
MWDTGAQMSAITPYMANLLNLQPIYQTGIGGAHGVNQTDIVVVHLEIPELGAYKDLKVAVCPFNPDPNSDIHMIIGMDLIALGDFVLSNGNDNTLFSFATPPSLTKIDLSAIQSP